MREADILKIANHTQMFIQQMDEAADRTALKEIYSVWRPWAKSHAVAPKIREHITLKFEGIWRDLPDDGALLDDRKQTDRKSAAAGGDR